MKSQKLSQWAKENNYSYTGAYLAYLKGNIPDAFQLPSGALMVKIDNKIQISEKIITYARVSTAKQKKDADSQSKRISDFCAANGWPVSISYIEIASGLNDNRKILNKILSDRTITKIVVEHKDRLTRFGFNHLKLLLQEHNCEIVVINQVVEDKEDLMTDFVSLITSMVARLYGQRRSLRKTEKLIEELKNVDS